MLATAFLLFLALGCSVAEPSADTGGCTKGAGTCPAAPPPKDIDEIGEIEEVVGMLQKQAHMSREHLNSEQQNGQQRKGQEASKTPTQKKTHLPEKDRTPPQVLIDLEHNKLKVMQKDPYLELCHQAIVHETCAVLNGNARGHGDKVSKALLAAIIDTNSSNSCFADIDDDTTCADLCNRVVATLQDHASYVVPKFSDIGCYTAHDRTHCDVDVRPEMLAQEMNLYAPEADHGRTVPHENGTTLLQARTYRSGMPRASTPQLPEEPMLNGRVSLIDGGNGGMRYDASCDDVAVQIANLFRIYPAVGVETGVAGQTVSFASAEADVMAKLQQYTVIAQAWASTVLTQLNDNTVAQFRQKWFGGQGVLSEAQVKARIVRTYNFIKRELIQGFHYVYPADDAVPFHCGENTLAYVVGPQRPEGEYSESVWPRCEASDDPFSKLCAIDNNGKYYVYICEHLTQVSKSEQIATIIHEAAHHSGPTDRSYNKAQGMAFPQKTQLDNAANFQNFGRDVVEHAWGCAQDSPVQISPYHCGGPCECQAFRGFCDWHAEVRQKCKGTCGLCQEPQPDPATPATPSPAPTPAPTQAPRGCADIEGKTSITLNGKPAECSQLSGFCNHASAHPLIQWQCPRTCRKCPGQGACQSTDDGATDLRGDGCSKYVWNPWWCGNYDDGDFKSNQMCCACGGGQ